MLGSRPQRHNVMSNPPALIGNGIWKLYRQPWDTMDTMTAELKENGSCATVTVKPTVTPSLNNTRQAIASEASWIPADYFSERERNQSDFFLGTCCHNLCHLAIRVYVRSLCYAVWSKLEKRKTHFKFSQIFVESLIMGQEWNEWSQWNEWSHWSGMNDPIGVNGMEQRLNPREKYVVILAMFHSIPRYNPVTSGNQFTTIESHLSNTPASRISRSEFHSLESSEILRVESSYRFPHYKDDINNGDPNLSPFQNTTHPLSTTSNNRPRNLYWKLKTKVWSPSRFARTAATAKMLLWSACLEKLPRLWRI